MIIKKRNILIKSIALLKTLCDNSILSFQCKDTAKKKKTLLTLSVAHEMIYIPCKYTSVLVVGLQNGRQG